MIFPNSGSDVSYIIASVCPLSIDAVRVKATLPERLRRWFDLMIKYSNNTSPFNTIDSDNHFNDAIDWFPCRFRWYWNSKHRPEWHDCIWQSNFNPCKDIHYLAHEECRTPSGSWYHRTTWEWASSISFIVAIAPQPCQHYKRIYSYTILRLKCGHHIPAYDSSYKILTSHTGTMVAMYLISHG